MIKNMKYLLELLIISLVFTWVFVVFMTILLAVSY